MLADNDVMATAAVKDLARAREFYEGKLGLKPAETREESVLTYKSGNALLLVYVSPFAGTNQATTATWPVSDVEAITQELKSRGVRFEHYDLPGTELHGDVHKRGNWRGAWFKDPDENIFHVVSR